ncbi:MAG: rhomboid family intramembrane serine protease [bacterium]
MGRVDGEWWRLITAGFLHLRPGHLLLNAAVLLAAATAGRRLLGGGRLVGVWCLGAVAGSAASLLLTRSWAAGASGGVAAVVGALAVEAARQWRGLDRIARRDALLATLPWLAALALVELTGRTDRAAHLGGLLAGALIARLPTRLLAGGAGLLTAGAAVFALRHALAPLPTTWPPAGFAPCAGPPPCGSGWTDGLAITCALPAPIPPPAGAVRDGSGHRWPLAGHPHTVWQRPDPGGGVRLVIRPDTPRGRALVDALTAAPAGNPVR